MTRKRKNVVHIDLLNYHDLQDFLSNIEPQMRKKAINAACRDAAKEVLKDSKKLVPVDQAHLKKALKVLRLDKKNRRFRRIRPKKHLVGASVGITSKHPAFAALKKGYFYALAQEYGWTTKSGSEEPGQPYLRPALKAKVETIKRTFTYGVAQFIIRTARRNLKKVPRRQK